MKVYRETIEVKSGEIRPTFYQITPQVREIAERSGVKDGICVVYSHHTTCSVITQEDSFDRTYNDYEFIQQDLLNILERLIPTCRVENQYMHPGPKLTEFAESIGEYKPLALNTDAHLRSVFFGRSESVVIAEGKLDMGQFGHIYFVDFDQTRIRTRQVQVQIIGE
jgi:secondary thiamine-phosphate synthase enzyme